MTVGGRRARAAVLSALVPLALLAAGGVSPAKPSVAPQLRVDISWQRNATWRWQDQAGVGRTRSTFDEKRTRSVPYLLWVRKLWTKRHHAARRFARRRPPHYGSWLCIHGYEGAWNANTGNGYYGGLQMDLGFQRLYGLALLRSKGTADHWTPLEQMWVAERAHASGRGFWPWPNTARYCHLI